MEEATEDELKAVFGARADYYLSQWHGTGSRATNWAAFLLSGLWLPYRRMYRVAMIFYLAIVAESILEALVFGWFGFAEVPKGVEVLAGLVFAMVCGVWGNRWYFARVRRIIAETRSLALEPDAHIKMLHKRGGTRLLHAVGFVLLFLVVTVLAFAAFDTATEV